MAPTIFRRPNRTDLIPELLIDIFGLSNYSQNPTTINFLLKNNYYVKSVAVKLPHLVATQLTLPHAPLTTSLTHPNNTTRQI